MEAIGQNLLRRSQASTGSSSRAATSPSAASPRSACARARSASGPPSRAHRSGSATLRLDGTIESANDAFAAILELGRRRGRGAATDRVRPGRRRGPDTPPGSGGWSRPASRWSATRRRRSRPGARSCGFWSALALVRDASGAPSHIIVQGIDISDRKRAETEREKALRPREHAERDAGRGRPAQGRAHLRRLARPAHAAHLDHGLPRARHDRRGRTAQRRSSSSTSKSSGEAPTACSRS